MHLHPAMLQQLAAERIREMIETADNARRAEQARRARNTARKRHQRPGPQDPQRECGPVTAAIGANPGTSAADPAVLLTAVPQPPATAEQATARLRTFEPSGRP